MWANNTANFRIFALFILIFLTACGTGSKDETDPNNNPNPNLGNVQRAITNIIITPSEPQLTTNDTIQFDVVAQHDDGTEENITADITLAVDNTDVATINSDGSLTTLQFVETITITASYLSEQTTLQLEITPSGDATLEKFEFSPDAVISEIAVDQEIVVTGTYSDGSVNNKQTLTVTAIDDSNPDAVVYQVSDDQKSFEAVVDSTLTSQPTINLAAIPDPVTLSSINIQATIVNILTGGSVTPSAEATYSDNSTADISGSVVWNSDNLDVLSYDGGTNTFIASNTPGTANISASFDGIVSNSIEITVTVTEPELTSIVISTSATDIETGTNITFTAMGQYGSESRDISADVQWQSSNTTVLNSTSTSSTFLADNAGTSNISASLTGINSNSISVNVSQTAAEPALESITISPNTSSIETGATVTFIATGKYGNENRVITSLVTWAVDNTAVLNVAGSPNAFNGLIEGSANVSASLDSVTSSSVAITVTQAAPEPSLETITISSATSSVETGSSITLIARGKYGTQNKVITSQVSWTIDNTGVLSQGGSSNVFNGISEGDANVTASLGTITSSPYSITVNQPVVEVTLQSISINPSPATITEGQSQTFTLLARYSDNPTQDIVETNNIQWTLTNNTTSAESNNNTGLFSGAAGSYTVQADFGGLTATAQLTIDPVVEKIPTGIQILEFDPALPVNAQRNLSVNINYSNAQSESVTDEIRWVIDDTDLFSMDGNTLIAKTLIGQTNVTAYLDSQSLSTTVGISVIPTDGATIKSIYITDSSVPMLTDDPPRQLTVHAVYSDNSEVLLTEGLSWKSYDESIATVDNSGKVSSEGIADNVIILASYTDPTTSKPFADGVVVSISGTDSYDYMRLDVGINLANTFIENTSEIKPTVDAFNNPVGLLDEINLISPRPGFFITLNQFSGISSEHLTLIIDTPSVASFDKSQATVIYRALNGEIYLVDDTADTNLSITLESLGAIGESSRGSFSATLCRESIVKVAGSCSAATSKMELSGSFFVKTEADRTFQSYAMEQPKLIENDIADIYQQVGDLSSYYHLLTTIDSEYNIRTLSDGALVEVTALNDITELGTSSANGENTEQSLTFTATSATTMIRVDYLGLAGGSTFQLIPNALAATAQGNAATPLPFNNNGVFFNKPGQVDHTSSYYELDVSPGYSYRISIDPDNIDGNSKSISGINYSTNISSSFARCDSINECVIDTGASSSIYLKVDGPATDGEYAKFNISMTYNNVRDPNDSTTSLSIAIADIVELKGQVPYGSSSGSWGVGTGTSDYWVSGIEANKYYKVTISGLQDNSRLWVNTFNSGFGSATESSCNSIGTPGATETYCVIKASESGSIPLSVENSWQSVATTGKGSTYILNMFEVLESDVFHFSTFRNDSTESCFGSCEIVGYTMFMENSLIPFARSITQNDEFHKKLLHLMTGETVYIRIEDIDSLGNAYSISIGSAYKNSSTAVPTNPDEHEGNDDNNQVNATTLITNSVSDHTLSNDNNTFSDIDWFTFTAP